MNKFTYIAVILLVLAVAAWTGVVYFAQSIQQQESDLASAAQSQEQTSDAQTSSVRLHALAQDSAAESATLDSVLGSDVASIVSTLQATGKSAGVDVTLSGALPESAPSADAAASQINAIGFVVEGSGTFTALMRVAELLETLPLPSSVQQLDLQRVNDSSGAPTTTWHLNAYLRVLTSADISS